MKLPFMLSGSIIRVFRHSLEWTSEQGEKQSQGEPTIEYINNRIEMLKMQGVTEYEIKELDATEYQWLDGIDVGEKQSMQDAIDLWQMGEAAYLEKINAPTDKEKIQELEAQLTDTQIALADIYEENILLDAQLTDTQIALTEIYENMGV